MKFQNSNHFERRSQFNIFLDLCLQAHHEDVENGIKSLGVFWDLRDSKDSLGQVISEWKFDVLNFPKNWKEIKWLNWENNGSFPC